ncbi:MAG: AI-2E family transporter [Bacteroidetes bacterium]|nr:MAG: AI-2E family transporter [Bacteroidota bacterium]
MTEQSNSHHGTRFLVIVAALVIIIFGINQAQSVVAMFLFSVFLALIATSPVLWMERKGVPTFIAVIIVMVSIIIFLLMIGGGVGASLSAFSDALPFYQQRLQEEVLALKPLLASKNIIVTDKVLLEYFNPGPVMGIVVGLLAEMGTALSNILIILLTVTFLLLEASSFPIKLRALLGNPKQVFPQFIDFVNDIKRYMFIKMLINLTSGTLITIWLYVLGVDFPVMWGFLTFLLLFIPNVGSVIAAIPAVLLALIQLGVGSAALTAAGYFVIGTILGNIIEPRIMGRRLGISTFIVFLSVIFWGSLLGPMGVILCIPLTLTLKFVFECNKSTLWIAMPFSSKNSTKDFPPISKGNK